MARLQYENVQRREQFEECSTLEAQKQALESHIRKKSENLANLKPQLKTILNSAVPVQKFLQMPLIEENDQLELAKYLPRPLFILYNEVRAYGQACDTDVQVQVLGNIEEAKAEFESNRQKRLATTGDGAQDEEQEEGHGLAAARGRERAAAAQTQVEGGHHHLPLGVPAQAPPGTL